MAAPGSRVRIVSARTCQTPVSSRTSRPFPLAPVPFLRVARDLLRASTIASRAAQAGALRTSGGQPAARGGLPLGTGTGASRPTRNVPTGLAGRLTGGAGPPASGVTGVVPSGQDLASAILASHARASRRQVSTGRTSTGLTSTGRTSTGRTSTGPGNTGRGSTGRGRRATGPEPSRWDRTSPSMVLERVRTAGKRVRMATKQNRSAPEQVSTVLATLHMAQARTITARTTCGSVQGWASSVPGHSHPGRTRARTRMRREATGTARGRWDRVRQGPASPAVGRPVVGPPGTSTRTALTSTARTSTALTSTGQDSTGQDSGDQADLGLDRAGPGQARAPGGWGNHRAGAAGGWGNHRAGAAGDPARATAAGG
jgi:hypothetical protein